MSDELSKAEKSQSSIEGGWIWVVISFGCYLFQSYEAALLFLFLGIFLLVRGYLGLKFGSPTSVLLIIILVVLGISGIFLNIKIRDYMVQQAPQQIVCGAVQNIRDERYGRTTMNVFDLVGEHGQEKFLYYKHRVILSNLKSPICIRYSIDKRWDRYPHIFEIYPESSR